jgi:hypothetical protein
VDSRELLSGIHWSQNSTHAGLVELRGALNRMGQHALNSGRSWGDGAPDGDRLHAHRRVESTGPREQARAAMTLDQDRDPHCASCGRRMTPRRSTKDQATPARYCSAACRKRRVRPVDLALEAAIETLLAARPQSASICPSEAAREVEPEDWKPLMEPARRAARRLVLAGRVEITQGSRPVDPSTAKGPIRVRRVR